MNVRKRGTFLSACLLLLSAIVPAVPGMPVEQASAATTPSWTSAGRMYAGHFYHTNTVLPDGSVLVTGGRDASYNVTAFSEIYDPDTDIWVMTKPLSKPRIWHSAHLLNNGKVMIAGGSSDGGAEYKDTEIFDPATGEYTPGPVMNFVQPHQAIKLRDGRILAVLDDIYGLGCEIYDPATNKWTVIPSMSTKRSGAGLIELPDGRVLLAGGYGWKGGSGFLGYGALQTAEIYDPKLNKWSWASNLPAALDHINVNGSFLLKNGKVVFIGSNLKTPLIYDPAANTWKTGAAAKINRFSYDVAMLPDETIIKSGGFIPSTETSTEIYQNTVEKYNPATNTWTSLPNLPTVLESHSSVVLKDGRLMIIGGLYLDANRVQIYPRYPQVYGLPVIPVSKTFTASGSLNRTANLKANGAITPNGTHAGNEIIVFQLMDGTTPIKTVTFEEDITARKTLTASFDVPGSNMNYQVKVFVTDRRFSASTMEIGTLLAPIAVLK
ncbi:Kelch repeat-containing protein [Brevibacillus dissolubilis]|uniref:Kelch repeat-containing protein n=1 Tax=Brevibacillus dissolubilis TaxID=1844116 RepID=UPI00159BE316|nr:kelch repeat-containing protein [Brevibacillus dissolubilis]